MTPISKFFGDDNDKRKELLEEAQSSFFIVTERLEKLVKKGVISDGDLSYAPVVHGGKNVPKIISTIERLLGEGHLKGVENSIEGFCYLAGMGIRTGQAIKQQEKK
jgi:hypothetical protein